MRKFVRAGRSERGQTLLEFALIGMLLFMLMFGIVDAGRIFSAYQVITNEAREGTRWGTVRVLHYQGLNEPECRNPASSADVVRCVETRTKARIDGTPSLTGAVVTASLSGGASPTLTVVVQYNVSVVTPILWPIFGSSFPIMATSQMRAEE